MSCEWEEVRLGETLSFVVDNRGKTPPTCEKSDYELIEVNAISATMKLPQYNAIKKFVDKDTYDNWFRSGHPKKGDILVPTVGTLGAVSYMNENRGSIAQNLIALRVRKDKYDGEFLYYLLCNPDTRQRLLNLNIGGVQPSIKVPHLLGLSVSIPSKIYQRAIAATLSCLDDKIENNNRICKTLEDLAQAIFKRWFVDFEFSDESGTPYKSSSGEMVESEHGMIPKGWRIGTLGEICSYVTERISMSKCTYENYISTENMLASKKGITPASTLPPIQFVSMYKPNDVLISNIRPYFEKIWFADKTGGCSNDVLIFRANNELLSGYLYNVLFDSSFFSYATASSKGTKMPRGDKTAILNYPIAMPQNEKDKKFQRYSSLAMELLTYVSKLNAESRTLAALRDTLLPRLMSGEIRVPVEV